MQLNITGHHVDITPPLRQYIDRKLIKLTHHSEHINQAQVTLTVEKLRQKAEATINLSGNQVFAQAESENMYASIDTLLDKLDRQVLKHKEKVIRRRQKVGG